MSNYLRSVIAGLTVAVTILFGLIFMLAGFGFLAYEVMHPPTHTTHVFLFAGLAVLGALMLPAIGSVVIKAAKSGLDVAGPYLPFGRRVNSGEVSADPPKGGMSQ